MKNVLAVIFICSFLIITVLIVIIIGYPISKTSHSSLTDEPNKNGFNFCVKEKRNYTRLLAMNLEMKDIYLNSEFQYYLKNEKDENVNIIKDIPKKFKLTSVCYLPKKEVWICIAIESKEDNFIYNYKVLVCSNRLVIKILDLKTSHDLKHPIYNKYPEHTPFDIDLDSETIKYLSPEEKVEVLEF